MILTEAKQIPFPRRPTRPFRVIIAASGYEKRAVHVANELSGATADRRIALAFADHRRTLSRPENDALFKSLGYELIPADGSTASATETLIRDVLTTSAGPSASVLVDYSSMTRVWYASLLSTLASLRAGPQQIDLFLVYSPSTYAPPRRVSGIPLDAMAPLDGFSGLELPTVPNALVAGLGYERHTALALYQCVDPTEAFALYAHPGSDPDFVAKVRMNNKDFLDLLPKDRVFTYDFSNLDMIAMMLNSLVSGLVHRKMRVILAPLGPKPFSMLSLILALREKTVNVWRVSAGLKAAPVQREPRGDVLAFWVRFER